MENSTEKKTYHVGKVQAGLLLAVITLLYLLAFADRQIFSVALQPMKVALGLSDTELGILQAVFNIGLGVLAIPGSILVDRWSRRKMIGIMALLWSLATFATGLCKNFVQLLIPRSIVGVGEAAYVPGGTGWLSVVFPKDKRARILAIFGVGAALGVIIGAVGGGLIIAKTHDWSSPFWIFSIPGIILGIAVFFFKDYATIQQSAEGKTGKGFLKEWLGLFKIKSFTVVIVGQTFWALFYMTFLGWLVAFLMRGYNLDSGQAGMILAGASLIGVIFAPFGGWITDVWHRHNKAGRAYMMAIVQAANVVTLLIAVLAMGEVALPVYIAIIMVVSIATSMVSGTAITLMTDVLPIKLRSSGMSWNMVGSYLVGASLGSFLTGVASDAFGGGVIGLKMAFLCIFPALILGFIVHFLNTRKIYVEDSARCNDEVFAEQK
jgi:MFS transporter, Spinster family, sphingosine-1-phosphate transporter